MCQGDSPSVAGATIHSPTEEACRDVDSSRVWLHLRAPLTGAFANCLTTAAPQFVSRAASIPTAIPLTQRF